MRPLSTHKDLLGYLVRRLLKMARIVLSSMRWRMMTPGRKIVFDPVARIAALADKNIRAFIAMWYLWCLVHSTGWLSDETVLNATEKNVSGYAEINNGRLSSTAKPCGMSTC